MCLPSSVARRTVMSSAAHPAIALPELRRRYEALGPLPQFPGGRSWVDRIDTFENFVTYGPDVTRLFAALRQRFSDTSDAELGRDCPPLFRLLMQAFPAAPSEAHRTG